MFDIALRGARQPAVAVTFQEIGLVLWQPSNDHHFQCVLCILTFHPYLGGCRNPVTLWQKENRGVILYTRQASLFPSGIGFHCNFTFPSRMATTKSLTLTTSVYMQVPPLSGLIMQNM